MSDVKLTAAQEKILENYRQRFLSLVKNTDKSKKEKANLAFEALFKLQKMPKPTIYWFDNLLEARHKAAQLQYTIPIGSTPIVPTREQLRSQADSMAYGNLESYWVIYYQFLADHVNKTRDEALNHLVSIVEECGPFWLFKEGAVVVCEKASVFEVNDKWEPHNESGPCIQFPGGDSIYAINGKHYASLLEAKLAAKLGANEDDTA